MARPTNPWPPQPKLEKKNMQMRVWWQGRWHYLGRVSNEAAWKAEYQKLLQLWTDDPHATARRDLD